MIQGIVTAGLDAIVPLVVSNAVGETRNIEAVIDTGFTDYLTLPPDIIAELDLPFTHDARVVQSDGQHIIAQSYLGYAEWHGERCLIPIQAAAGGSLLGMTLLLGSVLTMHIGFGGEVTIEPEP